MFEVRHYVDHAGVDLFSEWLKKLRDPVAKVQVLKRVNRMGQGNFGDIEFCGEGVWEMRIDVGPGYRVYYARAALKVMLVLCGGDKRKQDADIENAKEYWKDWQYRSDS